VKRTDPTLFRQQILIDGEWQDARDGVAFDVHNPADDADQGLLEPESAASGTGPA